MHVCIDGGQRWVELLHGTVVLQAKCDTLPFVVEADEGRTRILGIELEVRRGAGETRVTTLQERVTVSVDTGAGATEKVLGTGQQANLADGRLGRSVATGAAVVLV